MLSLPAPALTLRSLTERLAPSGLNLLGATTAEEFDRAQANGRRLREVLARCGTVVVVASGGRKFWQSMVNENGAPLDAAHPDYQLIAERCERISAEVCAWLARFGVVAEVVCPTRNPNLNFAQLAEMAGLGVVSPVAEWLMHPQFGPWVSVRFALLLEGMPLGTTFPRTLAGAYQPCAGCHRPCVKACPVDACAGGEFDVQRCACHRHTGGCASGCDMKRACPMGSEHRYGDEEERFRQASTLLALQRQYGLGWWKLVPKIMR